MHLNYLHGNIMLEVSNNFFFPYNLWTKFLKEWFTILGGGCFLSRSIEKFHIFMRNLYILHRILKISIYLNNKILINFVHIIFSTFFITLFKEFCIYTYTFEQTCWTTNIVPIHQKGRTIKLDKLPNNSFVHTLLALEQARTFISGFIRRGPIPQVGNHYTVQLFQNQQFLTSDQATT